ncbi:YheT family hydrolase [Aureibacter tunicatorum]|uniref:Serine aminopeptidase S33 domain-containing protein n=1 Tax=Aureibacter tunicatorum TaxID=866807 RepID=A0AAE3XN81_9BACT|nr:alpha/beta fold hydrolase [Aureibacter tunicatorum]MDR6239572.1 hypothetical protein [Aureibacter tunicatorum]BDD04049.1 alpha/beta hydrolase [Aureibacter tunicatorum]
MRNFERGSKFRRPWLYFNGHLETIMPSFFKKADGILYEEERVDTSDGDFLVLKWLKRGAKKLVVVTHGLEGDAERYYVRFMARLFSENGYDVLAWNNRSCGGVMNNLPRMYHQADTEDIKTVVEYGIAKGSYESVSLIGFSMGGNVTLNYLAKYGNNSQSNIKSAVAISVPCELNDCVAALDRGLNVIYSKHFLRKLKRKVIWKSKGFPKEIDVSRIDEVKSLHDFDDMYTAPMFGFKDAVDYYTKASSYYKLENVKVPFLILNSKNDPMLDGKCYPTDKVGKNPFMYLEMPECGGHVGYCLAGEEYSYADYRALDFVNDFL